MKQGDYKSHRRSCVCTPFLRFLGMTQERAIACSVPGTHRCATLSEVIISLTKTVVHCDQSRSESRGGQALLLTPD